MPKLYCNKCKKTLSVDSFYVRKAGKEKGRFIKPCKECIKKKRKEYTNSSRGKFIYRRKHLKNNYGLTVEKFNQMYADQNGRCAICGVSSDVERNLAVDHDHKTGKVRGLLCVFCNTLTGYVEKQPKRIKRVKEYLKTYECCT